MSTAASKLQGSDAGSAAGATWGELHFLLHSFLVRRRGPLPPGAAMVTKHGKRCEF